MTLSRVLITITLYTVSCASGMLRHFRYHVDMIAQDHYQQYIRGIERISPSNNILTRLRLADKDLHEQISPFLLSDSPPAPRDLVPALDRLLEKPEAIEKSLLEEVRWQNASRGAGALYAWTLNTLLTSTLRLAKDLWFWEARERSTQLALLYSLSSTVLLPNASVAG